MKYKLLKLYITGLSLILLPSFSSCNSLEFCTKQEDKASAIPIGKQIDIEKYKSVRLVDEFSNKSLIIRDYRIVQDILKYMKYISTNNQEYNLPSIPNWDPITSTVYLRWTACSMYFYKDVIKGNETGLTEDDYIYFSIDADLAPKFKESGYVLSGTGNKLNLNIQKISDEYILSRKNVRKFERWLKTDLPIRTPSSCNCWTGTTHRRGN